MYWGSNLRVEEIVNDVLIYWLFTQVWSLESGDCQLTLPGDHCSGVSCVTFNDQWVISGDNSGEIKVFFAQQI